MASDINLIQWPQQSKKKSAWSEFSGKTEKKIYFKQPKLNEKIKNQIFVFYYHNQIEKKPRKIVYHLVLKFLL